MDEEFLFNKLEERRQTNSLRSLKTSLGKIDFCSNDYLGIVKNDLLKTGNKFPHGSTGSRLLTGNYALIEEAEKKIAAFHQAQAGLIFNSGYDANVGLIPAIAGKSDLIIYDKLSHASIRDGIRLSFAQSFSFNHNDISDLEEKLRKTNAAAEKFVITESVFSMDGDLAPLVEISAICEKYHAKLIVDEAHATGIFGKKGEGLVQKNGLQKNCFARLHTFSKACGTHGAIVLGSVLLREYLVNFARSFIYTTALPPSDVQAIMASYEIFPVMNDERSYLSTLSSIFTDELSGFEKSETGSPIHAVLVPGNIDARKAAGYLQENNFHVLPILYPTVPAGKERLRIVLHAFNSKEEVKAVARLLSANS
jgi:8-amino-7-oxononanoate synthase